MEEKLYTIPLNEAVSENDECPLCAVERNLEHDLIDFVLGSCASYMESDTRSVTDKEGFCRHHFKMMFDYGNTLGNAWILKTHYQKTIEEMNEAINSFSAPSKKLFSKPTGNNSISEWTERRDHSCYICSRMADTYERYLDTFFILYKKDDDFRKKINEGKGFCIHHFGDICRAAESKMNDKEKAAFYPAMFSLMKRNMQRLQEDVSWFVDKFDYENHDKPWKDSKDALQRGMQKLKGGYPADSAYVMKK